MPTIERDLKGISRCDNNSGRCILTPKVNKLFECTSYTFECIGPLQVIYMEVEPWPNNMG
jgi:hypothetical protein